MTKSRSTTCERCLYIRWFLMAGGMAIAGIYVQPAWALRVAVQMPSALAIGVGICAAAAAVFACRLYIYLKKAR